ncbi:prepilin-type N-terminal cleavage/methylation domain-containing protein [Cellulomonas chengniuliangii]|uniref:prepilin-type N-terminal cleavage/methylation domain-containing protein n=1 Tax=Cellulomonas chengniuliangii TaxID=2968084 RepID=UPI001D0F1B85|nr:prepilin-type N-terminal cleavage/methylation domain-containing protein [Cellulomonas chengniuliangii]MCC2317424.1 prepilin-type N-terminal cleavage/methylation domain-containing protein [Cellulomonas chengniuliangii]
MGLVRERLTRPDSDSGMSLVEVIVAMFIFAIISSGIIYTMSSVLVLTRDSRARQVAANLAAEEIDLVRDSADLFALLDADRVETLNGDKFTVHRATQWVTDPAQEIVCGAGGGALRYKRVNVTVTWENMRTGTDPVRSDTVVQPDEKINDPAKGTILVSVLGATGTGSSGVTVTATPGSPANGATALTTAPANTDAQGCTYILKVNPGNYDVKVSRSGYVDSDQQPSSVQTVGVAAGESAAVSFQYDKQGTFDVAYAAGYTPAPGETLRVPAVPTTSFVSTYGVFTATPASSAGRTRSMQLHPFASGYDVFAGTCAAADPAAWPEGTDDLGQPITGERIAGVSATPGGNVAVDVPMGVVKLAVGSQGAGTRYLRAVSANAPATGDPGCDSTVEYSFGSASGYGVPANGNLTVALPYGSWKLFFGTGGTPSNWNTAVGAGQITPVGMPARTTVDASGVVTFDPRVVAP